jgi:hypothetical protein
MQPGDRIAKDSQTGTLIELKNTPNGISAKVRLDNRKIASWYWAKDLTVIHDWTPPVDPS